MSSENVIYTAPIPAYVVQQFEYGDWHHDPTVGTWLDIKGFDSSVNATTYADERKRRNPATDYRVVKTGE